MHLSLHAGPAVMLFFTFALYAMGCQEPAPRKADTITTPFEEVLSQLKSYSRTNQDSAAWFEERLKTMLPQLAREQQLDAYSAMGRAAYSAGRFDAAILYFQQATALAEALGQTGQQAKLISRQGNARTMQGKIKEALELQEKALKLSRTLEKTGSERAYILQGLAYAYQKGREPSRSIPYLEEALAYYQSVENWTGVVYTTNLMQTTLSEIDSLEQAQQLLEELLIPPISLHLSAVDSGLLLNNLGRILNMKGAYQEAAAVLDQAVAVKAKLNNPDSYAKTVVEQMTSLGQAGRWADCIRLSEKVKTDDFDRLSLYTRRDWYMRLSDCYAGAENMKKAYETRLKYETLYDSVANTKNREDIREVELRLVKEERARLQQAGKIVRQQRNLIIAAAAIVVLIGLFVFLLWRSRQRKEAAVLAVKADELKKNDQLRRHLFTNISHELRTPLTFVTASLQQIVESPSQNVQLWLPSLQHGVQQLQRLVAQILDLSRLEAGKLDVKLSDINASSFFNRIATNWQPAAQIKNVQLDVDIQLPDHQALKLDTIKVEQIVNNLLSNALKFTPPGGNIQLTVSASGQELLIKVSDSGRGIPKEQLPRIFERFFSVQKADDNGIGGTGIGLAFSRELAALMQGALEVQSQPGTGSTFYCRLPWHAPQKAGLPKVQGEAPAWQPHQPTTADAPEATLLVVEDNPDMQRFLHQILSPQYRVISAYDGAEALEVLHASDDIDLVVSDMMMPGMDGQQLLKALKSEEKWLSLPVVMLTARSDEQEKLQALSVGVDDYLTKPFNTQELLARLANLLKFRKLRQASTPESGEAAPSDISTADWTWLKSIEKCMLEEIQNSSFNIVQLAQTHHLSERQLYRRIKSVTGMTPNRYFWELRLHEAKRLLETGARSTVAEVSYAVGVETPEYFSKKYQERFGKKPIEYLRT